MTTARIEIGRFQWVIEKTADGDFHHLHVGLMPVGHVAASLSGTGYDWMLCVGDWEANDHPLPTLSAAKDRLAHRVRRIIADDPANDIQTYYSTLPTPQRYSHLED